MRGPPRVESWLQGFGVFRTGAIAPGERSSSGPSRSTIALCDAGLRSGPCSTRLRFVRDLSTCRA
eukprot:3890426-Pyramimonas_sp.AAC.1